MTRVDLQTVYLTAYREAVGSEAAKEIERTATKSMKVVKVS